MRRTANAIVVALIAALTTACNLSSIVDAFNEADVPGAIVGPTIRDTTRVTFPDTITHGVPFTFSFLTTGSLCLKRAVSTNVSAGGQDTVIVRPIDHVQGWPCGDAVLTMMPHSATAVFPNAGRGTVRIIGALIDPGGPTAIVDRTVVVR